MKKKNIFMVAFVLLLVFTSCRIPGQSQVTSRSKDSMPSQDQLIPVINVETLQSDKQRQISPQVDPADLNALVNGNNEFAFDIYQRLKATDGNLFYSPYSISEALAMTYAGARGNTEKQMAAALSYDLPQNQLHSAFNSLDQDLDCRSKGDPEPFGNKGYQLNITSAIWGQKGYRFSQDYLDVLAMSYGAGMHPMDFQGDPETSRLTINKWVSYQTKNKINDLIALGTIDPLTRLVLTNTIYFNAKWLHPFKESETQDGIFYLLDDSNISTPMMNVEDYFDCYKGEDYQEIELPYDNRQNSMVIVVPESGKYKEFEESLNAEKVDSILQDLTYSRINPPDGSSLIVDVKMPKFKYEYECGLRKTLSAMGMPDAFEDGKADFSGMTDEEGLFIGDVIHKAYVSVDEKGTEATAATAVRMVGDSGAPKVPIQFTIDRPFIFLIRDTQTGTILFVGRVLNPGA